MSVPQQTQPTVSGRPTWEDRVALAVAALFPVGALVAAVRTQELFALVTLLVAAIAHKLARRFLLASVISAFTAALVHEIAVQGYLNEMFVVRFIARGFYAFLVSVAVGVPFVVYRQPGHVGTLWRGEVPLGLAYWRYGFLLNALFATTAAVLATLADCPECGQILAAHELVPLWWLCYLAYFFLVVVGIWRSSQRYEGRRRWAVLARVAVTLDVIRFSVQLGTAIVPAVRVAWQERGDAAQPSDSNAVRVSNIGSAVGYSISYIDAVPKPGTALVTGQRVAFTVTVEYRLDIAQHGRIVLVFEDENDRILLPERNVVSNLVERGSGQATLSDTITLPPRVREVHLFVPLVPEGLTNTTGQLLITYPVR
jgi:hypothetical protein